MIGSLLSHGLSLLTGGGLGAIGHLFFGWLHDKQIAANLTEVERVAARKASYGAVASDWKHMVILLVFTAIWVWSTATGQDPALQHGAATLVGAGGAWYFGALTLARK